MKVERGLHLECKLRFPCTQCIELTYQFRGFLAKSWRSTKVKTIFENCMNLPLAADSYSRWPNGRTAYFRGVYQRRLWRIGKADKSRTAPMTYYWRQCDVNSNVPRDVTYLWALGMVCLAVQHRRRGDELGGAKRAADRSVRLAGAHGLGFGGGWARGGALFAGLHAAGALLFGDRFFLSGRHSCLGDHVPQVEVAVRLGRLFVVHTLFPPLHDELLQRVLRVRHTHT